MPASITTQQPPRLPTSFKPGPPPRDKQGFPDRPDKTLDGQAGYVLCATRESGQ
ncbi:hypothetical protein N658DRAFT_493752 [Parathielavia hyrcaniae]|uniref:Uncharacterized protein n=1 Tax=Parathielavia hyrcaniae TaxID=113614 RepID=A0AAN6T4T6_9PEZI|nr:hypothetical protein N658DRAFT_493752 [Parathielavia hyrcaniae]